MSSPATKIVIIVEPNGNVRHLVDEDSERFGDAIGEKVATERSSRVDTWANLPAAARVSLLEHSDYKVVDGRLYSHLGHNLNNHFWADLTTVNGPVLGPFEKYAQAINAEVHYLQLNNLPVCQPTTS